MRHKGFARACALALALTGSYAQAQAETLKLGVIGSMTGGGAAWGKAVSMAANLVAEEVNAQGGLEVAGTKYDIEVISYDDQFKASDTVAAYNRLVNQDGVKLMIVQTSNGAMATKDSMADDEVVALTAGYGGKVIEPGYPNLFRFYSGPRDYMRSLAKWMSENLDGKTVVQIGPNVEGGYEQAELAGQYYKEFGFDVLASDVFEVTQEDFSALITKIKALDPDILDLGSTLPATAGVIVRQARELGYDGQIIKTAGPGANEILAAAGAEASEGLIGLMFADPANPGYQKLVAAYEKEVGQAPNEMILPAYDGIHVMLRAVQVAGSVDDTEKVLAAFPEAVPMKSIQGDDLIIGGMDTYGANQQIVTYNYVGVIRDGAPIAIGKVR